MALCFLSYQSSADRSGKNKIISLIQLHLVLSKRLDKNQKSLMPINLFLGLMQLHFWDKLRELRIVVVGKCGRMIARLEVELRIVQFEVLSIESYHEHSNREISK